MSAWFPISKTLPRTGQRVELKLASPDSIIREGWIVDDEPEIQWQLTNWEKLPLKAVTKWRRIES